MMHEQKLRKQIEKPSLLDIYEKNYASKNSQTVTGYQVGAFSEFYNLFIFHFFVENNFETAKNFQFHTARSRQIRAKHTNEELGSSILNTLVTLSSVFESDYLPIIKDIPNWKSFYHLDNIKRGSLVYVVQKLLAGEQKEAETLWENGMSHQPKKLNFYLEERECVRCLMERDEQGLERGVLDLVRPDLHKTTLDPVFLSGYFYSAHAITYLKLAYHLGMNVQVEHELIPQDLVKYNPIENYQLLYSFMERDDFDIVQKENW